MDWSEDDISADDLKKERRDILRAYRDLLKPGRNPVSEKDKNQIRRAFDVALEAHQGVRRKSGEPYIFHPIAVAKIVKEDIGIGTVGIVCALLHDVVEDTDITLKDLEELFDSRISTIVDGLTKISELFDQNANLQAENFKKLILTLSQDIRVILIKLADRLHNMRTLGSMREDKSRKIASETLYLYAPLAHRLGLYNLKSEMEDLSLKYLEPEVYKEIKYKLQKSKAVRTRFLNRFLLPIERSLNRSGLDFEVVGRTKSIFSIYQKMQKQGIPFEEVYDLLALRIILKSEPENEKADCWKTYSMVTDFYKPNPDRLRDWISTPKANGYESLHITVMSPTGKWVEVQIRSKRMNDIAENGYASHWKYKSKGAEHAVDQWIERIRETIENNEIHSEDYLSDFRLNLFDEEIITFTPKGEVVSLPQQSTPVDFAFEIHSQVGKNCLGAKVNNKLVPLSYELKSGDQVEIITSSKGRPNEDWLKFVVTAKAKSKIKDFVKAEKKKLAVVGKTIMREKMRELGIKLNNDNLYKIAYFYLLSTLDDLYYQAKNGKLDFDLLKKLKIEKGFIKNNFRKAKNSIITNIGGVADLQGFDEEQKVDYQLSECCNPIPGDKVFGFIGKNKIIRIHRTNCPKALELQSSHHYRIIEAKWISNESLAFMAGISIKGIDRMGLVNEITNIISQAMNVNMRSINFESEDGIFDGEIRAYVSNANHLNDLMKKIQLTEGVHSVIRLDASN